MGLLGIGRKCILVIFQSTRWHTTITNGTKSSQPRMPQWLEVRHLLPLQLLQLLPCPLSSKRNSYVPLDLHDRHPQNHRVTHAWSRPRAFVQAVVGCWLQLYMRNVFFSPIIMTSSLMNTSDKNNYNRFLPALTCHKSFGTHDLFFPSVTSKIFKISIMSYRCHVLIHLVHPTKSPSFARGPYTSGNVPKLPRCHRFETAPGGANASGKKRLSLGSTIVHRTGTNGSTQVPPKNMEDYVPNWFLQVLKDVSSPERYEYLPYFTVNSLPWRENARFDCHFQCCSLLGFMQFNICAVAD